MDKTSKIFNECKYCIVQRIKRFDCVTKLFTVHDDILLCNKSKPQGMPTLHPALNHPYYNRTNRLICLIVVGSSLKRHQEVCLALVTDYTDHAGQWVRVWWRGPACVISCASHSDWLSPHSVLSQVRVQHHQRPLIAWLGTQSFTKWQQWHPVMTSDHHTDK